jgi:2,3-bisphosphoglycerate-dependent phosphoglycerate mutase
VTLLILLRNGQSLADARQAFAGLLDPELTTTGVAEAQTVADLLVRRQVKVDLVVTSPLLRAVQTADALLDRLGQAETTRLVSWRLSARDLGCLTGVAKPRAVEKFGSEALSEWRFSTDGRPPAASPERLRSLPWLPAADVVTGLPFGEGESLRHVEERLHPLWDDELRPALADGRTVLVVAHTDSLRALRRVVEGREHDEGDTLRVVPAQPLAYRTDATGAVITPALYLEDRASA